MAEDSQNKIITTFKKQVTLSQRDKVRQQLYYFKLGLWILAIY